MRRGLLVLVAGIAVCAAVCVSPVHAVNRYPVSIGVSYGSWTPSLDAYNVRWVDQSNPTMINVGGVLTAVYIRQPLDSAQTIWGKRVGPESFLFSSSSGLGLNAKLRLHNDVFALVEYDTWKQSVGSRRNFGGMIGYEANEIKLSPISVSLLYYIPTEAGKWWPHIYLGAGGGSVLVERSNSQLTNTGVLSTVTSTGSGPLFVGMAGLEYTVPVLQDRLTLFFQGRYTMGSFDDQFPVLGSTGSQLIDAVTGKPRKEDASVSVQGSNMKFGLSVNFGQLVSRPTKGVLSGFLEANRRRGGYAMAPSRGMQSGGYAMMVPYASESVQVVEGAGQVDEDRIRQVVREELLGARIGVTSARPVDDLAEQQLRSIRERRLQAEQELQQLQELLREEG
ncbi:MAG: hypothetical protein BWY06_01596 [Candidatus Latescibacteria bacterium ADurb.Bin168]|nr:MAG: hypothetical protein BWY06_01596 [Candidatus Latescibacteria bacterium ADurb.Bin168]